MNDGKQRGRLAYVAYGFPVLTQTFTVREVAALRERGVDVVVFAVRRDADAHLDPEGVREGELANYLPTAFSVAAVLAALSYLIRRPLRSLSTLFHCLGGGYRDDPLGCRLRAPLHFLIGTALARELERRGGFERVHAQFVDAGSTVAYVASRLTGVPFSFMNHTAYNPFLLPPKARHADLILSISEFDRERVVADCGEEVRGRIVVQRVGIRMSDWTGLERRPERGRVLSVGALRDKKGHDVLIRAAARLQERGVQIHLRLAGTGALEQQHRALAASLGVEPDFLGAVSPATVREELTRAAAFALPCKMAANGDLDGIPVAIMEAMAGGVPVVSTRLSGVPELIEDGVSGLLADPDDDEGLADALERVLTDDALAASLASGARDRVDQLHSLERTAATLAQHLLGAAA